MTTPPQPGGYSEPGYSEPRYPEPGSFAPPSGYPGAGGNSDPVGGQPLYIDPVTGQPTTIQQAASPTSVPPQSGSPVPPPVPPQAPPPGSPAPQYPAYSAYQVPPSWPTAPGYGYPAAYPTYMPPPQSRGTNGMAIASLVVSVSAIPLLFCYGGGAVVGLVGAILGHVARGQIRRNSQDGSGMALAGVITGWISVVLGIAIVALMGVFVWWAVKNSPSYQYSPQPYSPEPFPT